MEDLTFFKVYNISSPFTASSLVAQNSSAAGNDDAQGLATYSRWQPFEFSSIIFHENFVISVLSVS